MQKAQCPSLAVIMDELSTMAMAETMSDLTKRSNLVVATLLTV